MNTVVLGFKLPSLTLCYTSLDVVCYIEQRPWDLGFILNWTNLKCIIFNWFNVALKSFFATYPLSGHPLCWIVSGISFPLFHHFHFYFFDLMLSMNFYLFISSIVVNILYMSVDSLLVPSKGKLFSINNSDVVLVMFHCSTPTCLINIHVDLENSSYFALSLFLLC